MYSPKTAHNHHARSRRAFAHTHTSVNNYHKNTNNGKVERQGSLECCRGNGRIDHLRTYRHANTKKKFWNNQPRWNICFCYIWLAGKKCCTHFIHEARVAQYFDQQVSQNLHSVWLLSKKQLLCNYVVFLPASQVQATGFDCSGVLHAKII